ncbi:MAG: hypothetical protein GYA58_01970 [Anaerolineaceae bacterium]|jgi:hypothetical protein|nr:hypothetical protein [Anaerolineaceae bacterium]
MKTQDKDFSHGSALTQIVEHPSFKALNKADKKFGHYQINIDTRILIKYSDKEKSPWQFTFKVEDINTLVGDISSNNFSFLCLICGKVTICLLPTNDFQELLDFEKKTQQSITVELEDGKSMRVKSKIKELKHAIHHNDFPKLLFKQA